LGYRVVTDALRAQRRIDMENIVGYGYGLVWTGCQAHVAGDAEVIYKKRHLCFPSIEVQFERGAIDCSLTVDDYS
jgi:hypothetical protein